MLNLILLDLNVCLYMVPKNRPVTSQTVMSIDVNVEVPRIDCQELAKMLNLSKWKRGKAEKWSFVLNITLFQLSMSFFLHPHLVCPTCRWWPCPTAQNYLRCKGRFNPISKTLLLRSDSYFTPHSLTAIQTLALRRLAYQMFESSWTQTPQNHPKPVFIGSVNSDVNHK